MSKKDDLKVVFDFIADYLRDEKPGDKVVEKHSEPKASKAKSQTDKNVEHMLEIMKRVDVMDKMRKTTPVVPQNQRDNVENAEDTPPVRTPIFADISLGRDTGPR